MRITFLQIFIILVIGCQAQNDEKHMVFKNNEIEIKFPGSFEKVSNKNFGNTINETYEGYFLDFEQKILFHEDDQEKYYTTDDGQVITTQHVVTSSGYLSDLYIYPAIDRQELIKEIEKAFEPEGAKFKFRKHKEVKIGKLKVLNWRTQQKKNRFEYYLVLGKSYHYLFVSTPYGEQEYIESIYVM
jgi:hypothetical protein